MAIGELIGSGELTGNISASGEILGTLIAQKGARGVGISSIEKTGTSGLVDTYTITYTDHSTDTIEVTNGAKGDTGNTGPTGNGISSITKTGTSGLIDTYTITYTNGETTTFDVNNGEDGISPTITSTKSGKTTTLTITDAEGTSTATILDGEDGAIHYTAGDNITIDASNVISATGGAAIEVDTTIGRAENNPFIFDGKETGLYNIISGGSSVRFFKGRTTDSSVLEYNNAHFVYIVKKYSAASNDEVFAYINYISKYSDTLKQYLEPVIKDTTATAGAKKGTVIERQFCSGLVSTGDSQTISAKKTFSVLPESSITPTTDNQLANKKYVDDAVAGGGSDFIQVDKDQLEWEDTIALAQQLYDAYKEGKYLNVIVRNAINHIPVYLSFGQVSVNAEESGWMIFNGEGAEYPNNVYDGIYYREVMRQYLYAKLVQGEVTNAYFSHDTILYGLEGTGYLLGKNNTTAWTPTSDYNPATKKYVDDAISGAGYLTTETDPVYSASAAAGISASDITAWNGKSDFSGDYSDLTNAPTLASVATSGDYGDLLNTPVLPPTGSITMYAGSTAPTGYLICDGAAVSRTTYAALFGVIGTTYGTGDGSTTFNLPNLKGKVAVGKDSGDTSFDALGETGGEKAHTLTTTEMPSHGHKLTGSNGFGSADYFYKSGTVYATSPGINMGGTYAGNGTVSIANTGGDSSHNNLQPYIVLNYIIKY